VAVPAIGKGHGNMNERRPSGLPVLVKYDDRSVSTLGRNVLNMY